MDTASPVRAEELIMIAWTQRKALMERGITPTGVAMSRRNYDMIQAYHRRLGFLPEGVEDYITRYALFDLPILIDERIQCRVLAETASSGGDAAEG